jgi:hypothetical protein
VDHIEVVDVCSGEVLLFWDLPPLRAVRLARALRADLSQLEPTAFRERWIDLEPPGDREAAADTRRFSESDSWV